MSEDDQTGGLAPGIGSDSDIDGACEQCSSQNQVLLVTVRRDFPLRHGEKLGDWQWSDADGNRRLNPLCWEYGAGEAPQAPGEQLIADTSRAIFGWGIGRPALGSEGDNAGQLTTDGGPHIAAEVKLLSGDREYASARTSGANGEALLETENWSGEFTIRVIPDDRDDDHEVGPTLADSGTPPALLYRTLDVNIRLQNGLLSEVTDPYDPPTRHTYGRVGNRQLWEPTTDHLPLSLKPIWWHDSNGQSRNITVFDINLFVIHCTGGTRIGPALISFFGATRGVHYILDIDGHLIKLSRERLRLNHLAGFDRWQRRRHPNHNSIGLEIVNNTTPVPAEYATRGLPLYQFEQYTAVIGLARHLTAAFPGIRHRIIGHNDVATGPRRSGPGAILPADAGIPNTRLHLRKPWDPGERFRWELLEHASLGMVPRSHFSADTSYAGIFRRFPDIELREGDHDPSLFGGSSRSPFSGSVIRELKQDLADIGYSITNINGVYDAWLGGAVDRFLRHFFSASRGARTGRTIDLNTARRIKDVAEEVRSREQEWSCWLVRLSRATDAKFHTDPRHHQSYERGADRGLRQRSRCHC